MDPLFSKDLELANLIRIGWIMLIPVSILFMAILYKTAVLLNEVIQCIALVRYEVTPTLKELRQVAEHLETLSSKAVESADSMTRTVQAGSDRLKSGFNRLSIASQQAYDSSRGFFKSLLTGVRRSLDSSVRIERQ